MQQFGVARCNYTLLFLNILLEKISNHAESVYIIMLSIKTNTPFQEQFKK